MSIFKTSSLDFKFKMHGAIKIESHKILILLLHYGIFVNVPYSKGVTPFHLAIRKNCKNIVQLLLEIEFRTNLKD